MRIVYMAAGAGGTYCGACQRDIALVTYLQSRGHDVIMLPLYTPIRTDLPDPSARSLFLGGINCYLQQRFAFFRKTPRLLDWLFDRRSLVNLASRFAVSTRPEELGDMTVSVLRGEDGQQRKELDRLLSFLQTKERPDVVNITNSLLVALAPVIKRRLGVPVVCTLQGEESFVARLTPQHREASLALLRGHAQQVDLFISPHQSYADEMASWLGIPRERIVVIRPGVVVNQFSSAGSRQRNPFRIGWLSRVSPVKGLDTLVDAFSVLAHKHGRGNEILAVAGERVGESDVFWHNLRNRLVAEGLGNRLEDIGQVDLDGKRRFLQSLSAFCLPSRIDERRAVACLEAMASGVPVIVPPRGIFPELISLTGGGLLVPDDPRKLAEAFVRLRDDSEEADRMGTSGAEGVRRYYSAETMGELTIQAYQKVTAER
jgi:glycosyltransferase involved in cell wall biosynthesis